MQPQISAGMKDCWIGAGILLMVLLVVVAARAVYFAFFYRVFSEETTCTDIPQDSTVLVLGFVHQGETNGVIQPGLGNLEIVHQLTGCADRLFLIITQKAIIDAMIQEGLLENNRLLGRVPVAQMHVHDPNHPVRTFEALNLAVANLHPLPEALVLFAHDKQIERAFWDLRSLYTGKIILWKRNGIRYARAGWLPPLAWSIRELYLARPADFWFRRIRRQ